MSGGGVPAAVFRFEREMLASARRWLARQGLMVKEEFYTPWGVCDLVGVSLDKERIRQRLRLGQKRPIGPLIRVEILNAIPDVGGGQSATLERLESDYRAIVTPSQLRAEVDRLIGNKFVMVTERGTLQKVNGWAPLQTRIVALELKLNRVEDALSQAISHQAFADESFVGLPAEVAVRITNSPRAAKFRSEGVGILSVSTSRCSIVLSPETRCRPVNSTLQMHCVERFWRTRV
jgi:hypothetical protein